MRLPPLANSRDEVLWPVVMDLAAELPKQWAELPKPWTVIGGAIEKVDILAPDNVGQRTTTRLSAPAGRTVQVPGDPSWRRLGEHAEDGFAVWEMLRAR